MTNYRKELDQIKESNLYRQTQPYHRSGMSITTEEGDLLIDFSSNDYLGLSQHPALIESAQQAAALYGVGSSGSRLVSGTSPAHAEAESCIAAHKKTARALFFANGYLTSMATIPALVGKDDVIILDKL